METEQQNGRFTLFSSILPSNIYSILFGYINDFNFFAENPNLKLVKVEFQ